MIEVRKKIWKIIALLLIVVVLIASISVYGFKHFWFTKYDKVVKCEDGTIGLGFIYKDKLPSDVVVIPSHYRGYIVSVVGISKEGITKIIMPEDINIFSIEICPDLEEIVMPINFNEISIAPSHKEKVTLIVKENSKAKQYAIDNGYKYRIEE